MRLIPYNPTVIYEVGLAHNGDPKRLQKIIEAIVEEHRKVKGKKDPPWIKLQFFDPDLIATEKAVLPSGENMREKLRPFFMPMAKMAKVVNTLKEKLNTGWDDDLKRYMYPRFGCTVYNHQHVARLRYIQPNFIKVGSADFLDHRLSLTYRQNNSDKIWNANHLIVSTGMVISEELSHGLDDWVEVAVKQDQALTVMHCLSMYPPPYTSEDIKVARALKNILEVYAPKYYLEGGIKFGWSCHNNSFQHFLDFITALRPQTIEVHIKTDEKSIDDPVAFHVRDIKGIHNLIEQASWSLSREDFDTLNKRPDHVNAKFFQKLQKNKIKGKIVYQRCYEGEKK